MRHRTASSITLGSRSQPFGAAKLPQQLIAGLLAGALVATLGACAGGRKGTTAPKAASSTPPGGDTIVGTLNGQPIFSHDVIQQIGEPLRRIGNDTPQRRLQLLWVGFEEVVAQKLLHQEAAKRGISVAELLQAEVDAQLEAPSDAQVRQLYEDHRDIIGVDFEQAAAHLSAQLREHRRQQLLYTLVETLRAQADVRYEAPLPPLPRVAMDAASAVQGPQQGATDAKVTLIAFADFQCPYCARGQRVLRELLAMYPDELRVVYKAFPLAHHAHAQAAAEAAHCAHEQDKFWPYHDRLFAERDTLDEKALRRYAVELQLDLEQFDACLRSPRAKAAVASDIEAGRRHGVEGTPALFLNGIKLIGLLPLPIMQSLIERELGRS